MPITKVNVTDIVTGEYVTPSVTNRPILELEQNIDNILDYINNGPWHGGVFTGNTAFHAAAVTVDGGANSSPLITLRGQYDSDATTAVLSTKRDISFRNAVSAGGAYSLEVLDDVGGMIASMKMDGSAFTYYGYTVWHSGNDGSGSGLDADKLDGLESSTGATANTIAVRDASGDITMRYGHGSYFSISHAAASRTTDTVFYSSTDNYIRKNTASGFRTSLSVYSIADADAKFLPLAGGTVTGNINRNGGDVQRVTESWRLNGTLRWQMGHENALNGHKFRLWYYDDTGALVNGFTWDRSGNFTAPGDVSALSDRRLKSDIKTLEGSLNRVMRLRGVEYTKDNRRSVGLVAQEVAEVLPEVVHHGGEYLSVAYGNIVGVLIEAVKELSNDVESIKARI